MDETKSFRSFFNQNLISVEYFSNERWAIDDWLSRFSLRQNALFVPVLFSVAITIVLATGLEQGESARRAAKTMIDQVLPDMVTANQLVADLANLQIELQRLATWETDASKKDDVSGLRDQIHDDASELRFRIAEPRFVVVDQSLISFVKKYLDAVEHAADLMGTNAAQASAEVDNVYAAYIRIYQIFMLYSRDAESSSIDKLHDAILASDHARSIAIPTVIGISLLCIFISVILSGMITKPILRMAEIMKQKAC